MELNLITLQAAGGEGAGAINILMIVLLVVIFYFFMIRPQQKKQKQIRNFRQSMEVGSKVVTAGGIYGTIRKMTETTVWLEVAKGMTITVDKNSIYPSAADMELSGEQPKQ